MNKVLIVVDYQNDFVSGALGFPGAEKLDARIAERIRKYRADGDDVIFTLDTHGEEYPDTQEGRKLPVPHCIFFTPGHDLYGLTGKERRDTDRCFEKDTFGSDRLYEYLKGMNYSSIELCGLVLDICVLANAVLAKTALPEAEIVVDSNLVMSFDEEAAKATFKVMKSLQIEVL